MRKWQDNLWLFTPEEFKQLPDGTILLCIDGKSCIKGKHEIDQDTRVGHIAYGVTNPTTHELAELFTKFMLAQG